MNLEQKRVNDLISQKIIPQTRSSILLIKPDQQRVLQQEKLYELTDLVIGLAEIYCREQRSYMPLFGEKIVIFSSDLPDAIKQRYNIQASLGKEGSLLLKNGFCLLEKMQLKNANCSYLVIEDNYLTEKLLRAQTDEERQGVIKAMQEARHRLNVDLVIALVSCSQSNAEMYLRKDAEKKLDKFGMLLTAEILNLINNLQVYKKPVLLDFTIHPAAAVSDAPESEANGTAAKASKQDKNAGSDVPEPEAKSAGDEKSRQDKDQPSRIDEEDHASCSGPIAQAEKGEELADGVSSEEDKLPKGNVTLNDIAAQHGLAMMIKARQYLQPNPDGSYAHDKVAEIIRSLAD